MRVTRMRANAVTLVATSQELSALVGGARMALAIMNADGRAPAEARRLRALLARVLADYDAGLARARQEETTRVSGSPSSTPAT